MKPTLFAIIFASLFLIDTNKSYSQCYSAVQLDGVDDYLYCSSFANYDFSNFTIEMWINSADFNPNDIYVNWTKGSYIALGGWANDGSFNTWCQGLAPNSINSGSGTTPTTNNWHHIAYVFDGTNQIIYIGGNAVATVATSGSVDLSTSVTQVGLVIGARFDLNQQFTNTAFEDIRIWNTARTSAQINANLNSNLTGSESGLVAYYRFEDGSGSNTVTDLSGDGNTLTLHNMNLSTDWISGPFAPSLDNTITQNGNSLTANESTTGVQYQWIDCNNGNALISGETNQTFTPNNSGNYAVIITKPGGCKDTSVCNSVNVVGIEEQNMINNLSIYPNPVRSQLTINGELEISSIEIIDLTGKTIKSLFTAFNKIDISGLTEGVYFLRVNNILTKKFIKD